MNYMHQTHIQYRSYLFWASVRFGFGSTHGTAAAPANVGIDGPEDTTFGAGLPKV